MCTFGNNEMPAMDICNDNFSSQKENHKAIDRGRMDTDSPRLLTAIRQWLKKQTSACKGKDAEK